MLTAAVISRVARTAKTETFAGIRWELTFDMVLRQTKNTDWTGEVVNGEFRADYYNLSDSAAFRLVQKLNREQPWDAAGKMRAVASQRPAPRKPYNPSKMKKIETVQTILGS